MSPLAPVAGSLAHATGKLSGPAASLSPREPHGPSRRVLVSLGLVWSGTQPDEDASDHDRGLAAGGAFVVAGGHRVDCLCRFISAPPGCAACRSRPRPTAGRHRRCGGPGLLSGSRTAGWCRGSGGPTAPTGWRGWSRTLSPVSCATRMDWRGTGPPTGPAAGRPPPHAPPPPFFFPP